MSKKIKDLLIDATKYPVAVEAKLPTGAPKISTMLLEAADKIPVLPDLPVDVPVLPAPPTLPDMPGMPELGGLGGGRRYVAGVEVISAATPLVQSYTQPLEGVAGTVTSKRGM